VEAETRKQPNKGSRDSLVVCWQRTGDEKHRRNAWWRQTKPVAGFSKKLFGSQPASTHRRSGSAPIPDKRRKTGRLQKKKGCLSKGAGAMT